ncbi:unnamed protein product [Kuraishia capsulata CBS 1993]|uniref:Major facilitator superfamily (MFS) profile domain-containing protein n=1 Tax=Kuraishia capsulata CBS 1993 TaxID=1382522 RepID=W6MWB4_9ASCO|nr:uncharacterized protein KUCA_T00003127001 [Kuraishia capsulata CBS 1993]CDK27150.1 unnamed protein product [Kuraishia capsulata CBS 1993]
MEVDTAEFPEGGMGWLVLAAAWCAMAGSWGMVNSFGVYQAYYQTDLYPHEDAFKISVIGALQCFCIYEFSIPTVYLLHHLNARITITLGVLIQTFSLMMMSITNNIWQLFLVQGLLFGLGNGIVYLTAITIIMQWFKRRRALAVGIAASGSSIGGVIWPIAVKKLIAEVGIDWANRILGFIYIPMGAVMILFLKPRLSLRAEKKATLLPFNFEVLKDIKFVFLVAGFTITNFGLMPGLFFNDLYGQRLSNKTGHTLVEPQYYVSILNAMSMVGRIMPGFLADKFGRLNLLIPFALLSGIFPLVLWLPSSSSNNLFMSFVVLWGLSSGAMISLFPTLVPQLFGIKDNQSRTSLFFAIGGIGTLFGPIICGAFVPLAADSQGDIDGFDKVSIFIGVMFLAGTAMLVGLRVWSSRSLKKII